MLKDQVAIITGASRGIGKGIATKFAEQGMKLALVGSSSEIHNTKNELTEKGYESILSFQTDITVERQVMEMVKQVKEEFGAIDLLVNNAGIGFFKTVEETGLDEWKRVFDVNVQGVFLTSKTVLPYMKEKQFGTIITVSSDVGRYTIPNGSAYTATKYAVQGFMGSLAQEVKDSGIRVGTINPGMVDTYFANSTQGLPEKNDWLKTEDIANAALYMASAPKHMFIDEITLHPFVQNYPRI